MIERIGNATLYLGDCRDIFPGLSGIDAVISDPPYGIAHKHSGGSAASRNNLRGSYKSGRVSNADTVTGDNEPFDPTMLLTVGNVMLFGADHFRLRLPEGGRFLAWNKIGEAEPWDSFSDVEFIWHSQGRASRIKTYKWKGLACQKAGENNGRRDHPTQKPVGIMRWCIEQSAAPFAGLICDPFMGTGTTGVAAVQMGYHFIGVEIEQKYFDIACRRMEVEQRQGEMFQQQQSV